MKFDWKAFFLLGAIIVFGGWVRWDGIFYGLPYFFHPDETRIILDTLSMGHRHSLLPERPDYALLYRYFLLFIYGCIYGIGLLLGYFKDTLDFAYHFMVHSEFLFFVSRLLNMIIGTGCCVISYFIGRRFFSFQVGIISALFVAIEIQLVQHAQYALYSSAISFFILLSFYFLCAFLEKSSLKNTLKICGVVGLTLSIQNQGIFIVPSLILVFVLSYLKQRESSKFFFRNTCFGLGLLIACSLLGNFYWFFDFQKAWLKTSELMGVARIGFSSIAPYSYNFFSMLHWFGSELLYQDKVLGLIMLLGVVWAFKCHSHKDLLFLLYSFMSVYFFSTWGARSLHEVVTLLAPLCIWGAKAFVELTEGHKRKSIRYCFLSLIVAWSGYQIIFENGKKEAQDTRVKAKEWVEAHVPTQSRIVLDWPELSVPLQGEMPWLFYNPIAKRYYDNKLPASLKKRYENYLKNKAYYYLSDGRDITDIPVWPLDMPQDVIERAKRQQVFIDLYSHFHFKPIGQLIQEKNDYLIISSFSYAHFLLEGQPGREYMFNSVTVNRHHLSIRHADHFIDDNRHGFLFFLVKEGREFYESLLYNRLKNALLIKEFIPQENQLGPIIKIYKLIKE